VTSKARQDLQVAMVMASRVEDADDKAWNALYDALYPRTRRVAA
jgi:hypothetical protein